MERRSFLSAAASVPIFGLQTNGVVAASEPGTTLPNLSTSACRGEDEIWPDKTNRENYSDPDTTDVLSRVTTSFSTTVRWIGHCDVTYEDEYLHDIHLFSCAGTRYSEVPDGNMADEVGDPMKNITGQEYSITSTDDGVRIRADPEDSDEFGIFPAEDDPLPEPDEDGHVRDEESGKYAQVAGILGETALEQLHPLVDLTMTVGEIQNVLKDSGDSTQGEGIRMAKEYEKCGNFLCGNSAWHEAEHFQKAGIRVPKNEVVTVDIESRISVNNTQEPDLVNEITLEIENDRVTEKNR